MTLYGGLSAGGKHFGFARTFMSALRFNQSTYARNFSTRDDLWKAQRRRSESAIGGFAGQALPRHLSTGLYMLVVDRKRFSPPD